MKRGEVFAPDGVQRCDRSPRWPRVGMVGAVEQRHQRFNGTRGRAVRVLANRSDRLGSALLHFVREKGFRTMSLISASRSEKSSVKHVQPSVKECRVTATRSEMPRSSSVSAMASADRGTCRDRRPAT